MSTIAIIGGGSGGIVAANKLREALGREHRVVLFDRDTHHRYQGSFLWVMQGKRTPESVSRPFAALNRKGIEFVNAAVEGVDVSSGRLTAGGSVYDYDYLVLAPGAELAPDNLPGLRAASLTPFDLAGAAALRDRLRAFPGGRVVILVAGMPYRCPAAPYEAALQIDWLLRQSGVRAQSQIEIHTWESQPMPVAGKEMGDAVLSMLAAKDIQFFPGKKAVRVEPDTREMLFEDGDVVPADLLVGVPPHRLPSFCADSGLAEPGGWLDVDPHTLATAHERIWAIGDSAMIKLPVGLPLPKAGVFAHFQAETVTKTIISEITGKGKPHDFTGKGFCWVETGGPFAGYAYGDFYADPKPVMRIGGMNRINHVGKLLFERWWLWRWF